MKDFRVGDYEISRRQRRYTTALGFLAIGLGLGAMAAMLFTPRTGKQLRRDVRRKYEDACNAAENLGERASEIWERGEEWAEAARRKAEPVTRHFRRG
jgi:gas vesicle protein